MSLITTVIDCLKKSYSSNVAFLSLIALSIFQYGCGPSAGYFKLIQGSKELEANGSEKTLSNGDNIQITEYILDKSSKVERVDYDDSLGVLLIKYTKDEEGYLKQYDLNKNKTTWDANSNMSISLLQNNNLILSDPKGEKLYDVQKGEFIREIEKYLYLLNDGRTLQLSPEVFAGLDVRTGKKYWEGEGEEWKGYRQEYLDGDWCFVVAEGLHGIKIDEGKKWEFETPTSFTNTGKEVAKQVALSCLFAFAGGVNTSAYRPDITMNMNSQPLIVGDEIYFAARDKIVCLDKASGKLIWESQIDPELEAMKLYNISETEIALVGTGVKILNYALQKSDPPTVRVFQKKSGKIIAHYNMDDDAIAQSFISSKENLFLLVPNKLMVFNKDLKLIGVTETKREYGNFLNILTTADTLVIRTSKGILGLSKETYAEFWFKYCETPPVTADEDWRIPQLEQLKLGKQELIHSGFYWTPNEKGEIAAFDQSNWKEAATIPLLGNNFRIVSGKCIDFLDNKVKIISIY